jgi:CBS domain-containing protein
MSYTDLYEPDRDGYLTTIDHGGRLPKRRFGRRTAMESVRDLMTRDLVCCSPFDSVIDAAQLMRDNGIGDVLVVEDEQLVGIVTDRDIVIRGIASGEDVASLVLSDVCSDDPVAVDVDTDVDEAITMMREQAIRRLPVTDNGRPIGIVSLGDVAIDRDRKSALADISAQRPDQ